MKTKLYFLALIFLLFSCGSNGSMEDMAKVESALQQLTPVSEEQSAPGDQTKTTDEQAIQDPANPAPPTESIQIKTPDKIIKNGSMSLHTEDYDSTLKKVKGIIKKHNAYISNENEYKTAYSISNTIIIRIASADFEKLSDEIEKSGDKVTAKNIEMLDVTEEYVDIQARLRTKRETEERYREILKSARTINEILEVESYLKSVREEIESAEGRLKYLTDKVSYSTLTLTLQQENDNPYEPGFGNKMGEAFSGGWEIFLNIIIVFFYLWPLWLVAGVTLYFIFRKRKK